MALKMLLRVTSSLGHVAGDAGGGLPMLLAWLGLAELGLPRSECRFKVPDLEYLQIKPDKHHKQG
jgi:hypothetical protein